MKPLVRVDWQTKEHEAILALTNFITKVPTPMTLYIS
jgi:hypothetical protein